VEDGRYLIIRINRVHSINDWMFGSSTSSKRRLDHDVGEQTCVVVARRCARIGRVAESWPHVPSRFGELAFVD
jgi:hypothetical protein